MYEGEEWVIVEDFPNYRVSNYGRVKHIHRHEARRVTPNARGFPVLVLYREGDPSRYLKQVNVLVAEAFLDEPFDEMMTAIWHIDGDLTNCRADNLKWEFRPRVLEWNEMHRRGRPSLVTPRVRNNRTGVTYENAYDCAIADGRLESEIVWRVTKQARNMEDDAARYRYIFDN